MTSATTTTTTAAPSHSSSAPPPASALLRSLFSVSSLSRLTSHLSQTVPTLSPSAETATSHLSTLWSYAKPWTEFFNTKKLSPPTSPADLQERLMDNLSYFGGNYVICFSILALISVLIHPLAFLAVLSLIALYVFMFLSNPDALTLGSLTLKGNTRLVVFGIVSFFALYATNAIGIIGSWGLFGAFCSLLHAGARVSAKEPDFESPVHQV